MKQFASSRYFWVGVFALVFLLTQDYIFGGFHNNALIFGLPGWLYYFFAVHILLVLAIWQMVRRYWKNE